MIRRKTWRKMAAVALVIAAVVALVWWRMPTKKAKRAVTKGPVDPTLTLLTGYCNCGKCCGWKKSWFGFGEPVYNYGPMKGKPKKVGMTASGTIAKRGTLAADPKVYPMGTRIVIPGYGTGVVEDVGGAIKGKHLDLWFPNHYEAHRWGSQWKKVKVLKGKSGK